MPQRVEYDPRTGRPYEADLLAALSGLPAGAARGPSSQGSLLETLAALASWMGMAIPGRGGIGAPLPPDPNVIRLFRKGGSWIAEFLGPHSGSVREAFGGTTLPTPFLSKAPAQQVLKTVREQNPGVHVELGGEMVRFPTAPGQRQTILDSTGHYFDTRSRQDLVDLAGEIPKDYLSSRGGFTKFKHLDPRGLTLGRYRPSDRLNPQGPFSFQETKDPHAVGDLLNVLWSIYEAGPKGPLRPLP